MSGKQIKTVAIYLRKSRDDGEEDILKKHRIALTEFAEKNQWEYELFEEAAISGEFLDKRPIVSKLLDRIENLEFDAILVKALDRLSRGDEVEFGELLRVLRNADCLIATPDATFDPSDLDESMFISLNGIFAHRELKTIKKRFQDGKKIGAKDGKMTNGKPPYPYFYHKEVIVSEKGQEIVSSVKVDPVKLKVYEEIKELYISRSMGTEKIAFHLNQKGILSPNGKTWSSTVVSRILLHEFHMGITTYGRTRWKKNRAGKIRIVKLPREEWYIGSGNWPILKSESEHNEIMRITQDNNHIPSRAKQGVFPTSGILICQKCGYSMRYSSGRLEAKSGKIYYYTKCSHKSPLGEKCGQRGIKMDEEFYNMIVNSITERKLRGTKVEKINNNTDISKEIELELNEIQNKIIDLEKVLIRIKNAYNAGAYELDEFIEEKKKIDVQKKKLSSVKETLVKQRETTNRLPDNVLYERIDSLLEDWDKYSSEYKNKLLKNVVKKILYNREDNILTLGIEYL